MNFNPFGTEGINIYPRQKAAEYAPRDRWLQPPGSTAPFLQWLQQKRRPGLRAADHPQTHRAFRRGSAHVHPLLGRYRSPRRSLPGTRALWVRDRLRPGPLRPTEASPRRPGSSNTARAARPSATPRALPMPGEFTLIRTICCFCCRRPSTGVLCDLHKGIVHCLLRQGFERGLDRHLRHDAANARRVRPPFITATGKAD